MKHLCIVLFFAVLFSACIHSPQLSNGPSTFDPDKKELKILSWNIQMLPPLIGFNFKKRRAKAISETLIPEGYDIIIFQEAFHKKARKILWKQLKETYPFQLGPANMKALSIKGNSGVWILSKMPLKQLGTIKYSCCKKIDCFGRKGALLAQGEWQGQAFQVLGTHLQADYEKLYAPEVRGCQMIEIKMLIDSFKTKGVPQILAGDFNTDRATTGDYQRMLQLLDAEDGILLDEEITLDGVMDDFNNKGAASTSFPIIDYILYRANGHEPEFVERRAREFTNENWHDEYKGLSDHNAVEIRIRF